MSLASSSLFWSSATPVITAVLLLGGSSGGGSGCWQLELMGSLIVVMYASLWDFVSVSAAGSLSGSVCRVKGQKTESCPAAVRLLSLLTPGTSASTGGRSLCCKYGLFSNSATPSECTILMGTFFTAGFWLSITCSLLKYQRKTDRSYKMKLTLEKEEEEEETSSSCSCSSHTMIKSFTAWWQINFFPCPVCWNI